MSNTNGKITGSVSIDDIKTVFGLASNDLATVITMAANKINKWALWKPVYGTEIAPITFESMRHLHHCGLSVFANGLVADKDGKAVAMNSLNSFAAACKTYLFGGKYEDGVKYEKPVIDGKCGFRLSDFRNPVDSSKGYDANAYLDNALDGCQNSDGSICRLNPTISQGEYIDMSTSVADREIPDDTEFWTKYNEIADKETDNAFNQTNISMADLISNAFGTPGVSIMQMLHRAVLILGDGDYRFYMKKIPFSTDSWLKSLGGSGTFWEYKFVEFYTELSAIPAQSAWNNNVQNFRVIPYFCGTINIKNSPDYSFAITVNWGEPSDDKIDIIVGDIPSSSDSWVFEILDANKIPTGWKYQLSQGTNSFTLNNVANNDPTIGQKCYYVVEKNGQIMNDLDNTDFLGVIGENYI